MPITTVDLRKAVEIARAYGATKLILFGSYLEDPQKARDLDLAVDGVPGWKLFELAARLEEALRIPLDLVPLSADTPLTRRVEAHGEVLYAA